MKSFVFIMSLLKLSFVRFESSFILFSQGQETTANLLSFAMMCLWQNKDVFQR
jgi:cytochrome P450